MRSRGDEFNWIDQSSFSDDELLFFFPLLPSFPYTVEINRQELIRKRTRNNNKHVPHNFLYIFINIRCGGTFFLSSSLWEIFFSSNFFLSTFYFVKIERFPFYRILFMHACMMLFSITKFPSIYIFFRQTMHDFGKCTNCANLYKKVRLTFFSILEVKKNNLKSKKK